jgi:ribose 5-phosphate isomerase B
VRYTGCMKVFIGADHRGFELKSGLKSFLVEQGYSVEDVGATSYDHDDDYPDFAYPVALRVVDDEKNNRGILVCGSGMGMDVVANKVRGVRATVAYSRESAVHARANDNINVITLAGDTVPLDDAKKIAVAFLMTQFTGEVRHLRRLKKIEEIEEKHFK